VQIGLMITFTLVFGMYPFEYYILGSPFGFLSVLSNECRGIFLLGVKLPGREAGHIHLMPR
jgi:hypothetical protein